MIKQHTNDLQVPFDVDINDWQRLCIMRTLVIVANHYIKLTGNQS